MLADDMSECRGMTFFGDDKQLPPFGEEMTRICSVFDSAKLWGEMSHSLSGSSSCVLRMIDGLLACCR